MRAFFAKGNLRNSILNSYVCDGSLATAGPLPADTTGPVNNAASESKFKIKILSNPVSNSIDFSTDDATNLQNKEVALYTVQGKLLHKDVLKKSTHHSITVSHLPAGLYILQIGSGKETVVFKVVKL